MQYPSTFHALFELREQHSAFLCSVVGFSLGSAR